MDGTRDINHHACGASRGGHEGLRLEVEAVQVWFTPPQIARQRGVKPAKVLAWITRGELAAVNCADQVGGRPRWRISPEALTAFDAARSSKTSRPLATQRRSTKPSSTLIEFF